MIVTLIKRESFLKIMAIQYKPEILDRLATLLVRYSLAEQLPGKSLDGKNVQIRAEECASPLVERVANEIKILGGRPLSHYVNLATQAAWMENATDEQLQHVPEREKTLADMADASLRIKGTERPDIHPRIGRQLDIYWSARGDIIQRIMSKPWTVVQFPTQAEARLNGFESADDYASFVFGACIEVD